MLVQIKNFKLIRKTSHFLKINIDRVRSGNSGQKSAVLSAFFFNQLKIYCLYLCTSIMDFSIFTLVRKNILGMDEKIGLNGHVRNYP